MSTTPPNKQIIECPACKGQLRAPATDEFVRLRCPHCAQQFALGIPDAEVVDEYIPDAEVVPAAPAGSARAAGPSVPAASGPASDAEFTGGEKVVLLVALGLMFLVVNAAAWFFKPKQHVNVVDRVDGRLAVVEDHYYLDEGFLFGSPAMVMRWFGLQSPERIKTADGEVEVAAIAFPEGVHRLVVVNRTAGDIYYSPVVYGDEDGMPPGLETGTTRIGTDSGAAVLDKTHGEIRFGCDAQPGDVETFRSRKLTEQPYTVLAWVTDQDPATCASPG